MIFEKDLPNTNIDPLTLGDAKARGTRERRRAAAFETKFGVGVPVRDFIVESMGNHVPQ